MFLMKFIWVSNQTKLSKNRTDNEKKDLQEQVFQITLVLVVDVICDLTETLSSQQCL